MVFRDENSHDKKKTIKKCKKLISVKDQVAVIGRGWGEVWRRGYNWAGHTERHNKEADSNFDV